MKLNKNEQNYLLTILFKSYILQSVICSGIILVCTVSLDMGLTWVLDRYVEHYYLICYCRQIGFRKNKPYINYRFTQPLISRRISL